MRSCSNLWVVILWGANVEHTFGASKRLKHTIYSYFQSTVKGVRNWSWHRRKSHSPNWMCITPWKKGFTVVDQTEDEKKLLHSWSRKFVKSRRLVNGRLPYPSSDSQGYYPTTHGYIAIWGGPTLTIQPVQIACNNGKGRRKLKPS